jgi:hypothetical protein
MTAYQNFPDELMVKFNNLRDIYKTAPTLEYAAGVFTAALTT